MCWRQSQLSRAVYLLLAMAAMASASAVKLTGAAAFRTSRNLWMLEELGVAYEHVSAMPRSKEAYAANPFGKVPALHDPDVNLHMYESSAINTYLGDKYQRADLVPVAGTAARGRYEQLIATIMAELDAQGLWIHRKHESLGDMFGASPEAVAHAQRHSAAVVAVLAAELEQGGGPFLLGEEFSAADILFVSCLDWAEAIGWASWLDEGASAAPPGLRPRLGGPEVLALVGPYHALCRGRPAYAKVRAMKAAT